MAEILIKARNATHPDPEIDRVGCYKRGDPVVVRDDGHVWGAKEGLPNFVVVKIPGVAASRIEALIQAQTEDDAGSPVQDENGAPRAFRRRRWRVLVDNIPAAIRNQLLTTGSVTVTPAQVRNYVRRVRGNVQFGEL